MQIKTLGTVITTAFSLISAPALAEVSAEAAAYLDASKHQDIGMVFEAYLSPHQEGGEEEDVADAGSFASTQPSRSRDQREADGHTGHALMRFTKDMSRAYVDVQLAAENLSASDEIMMFHIHCGRPGILGPIIIDFSLATDIYANIVDDGVLSVVLTNKDLTDNIAVGDTDVSLGLPDANTGLLPTTDPTTDLTDSAVGALTRGCVIPGQLSESTLPIKTHTIAGLAHIAKEDNLYFNLHTAGQTYYGDMRGQVYSVSTDGTLPSE